MIYIGSNEISNIMLGDVEIYGIYAGDLQIYPTDFGTLTGISLEDLTWVTDIPASGGTATSANCSYQVYAEYDSGKRRRITNYATVTGSTVIGDTTAETRELVGTLTLTASYSGFTDSDTVDVYQERYYIGPVSITINQTKFDIGYSAITTTNVEAKICNVQNVDNMNVFGCEGVWHSTKSFYLSNMANGNYRFYVGGHYNDGLYSAVTPGQVVVGYFSTGGTSMYTENGVLITGETFNSNFQNNQKFTIGGIGTNPAYYAHSTIIYYFKIYEGSTLVRDLVPWVDNNGYGCLKDNVSGTIYSADDPTKVTANFE